MTRIVDGRLAAAFVLLVAVGAPAMPARAQGVAASFDCAKAASVAEKFICSRAVLRWNDLALSRSYAAAKAATAGSAGDDLLLSQRDWLRERDRRCLADRTFKALSGPSTELADQAYQCLQTVYLDRRRQLQDLGSAPLLPIDITEIDLRPIAAARPEIAEAGGLRVADIGLSPDGTLAAILLPSLELDGPDQIWLYRVADRRLTAATPSPDLQQPHPDGTPAAIEATAWQGDTLYARVATWGGDGESEAGTSLVYAANIDGSIQLDEVPADIAALLDGESGFPETGQDEMTESDGESPQAIRENRDFLAWADDLGHGTIELKTRKRAAGSPADLVAWGGWELANYLFDANRSLLVYPADTGITVFDMATCGEQRIASTSQGDRPYAVSNDFGLFVWSSRNACGDEFLAEQDDGARQRFCLAHLAPEGSE